jgi:hypothetical protein
LTVDEPESKGDDTHPMNAAKTSLGFVQVNTCDRDDHSSSVKISSLTNSFTNPFTPNSLLESNFADLSDNPTIPKYSESKDGSELPLSQRIRARVVDFGGQTTTSFNQNQSNAHSVNNSSGSIGASNQNVAKNASNDVHNGNTAVKEPFSNFFSRIGFGRDIPASPSDSTPKKADPDDVVEASRSFDQESAASSQPAEIVDRKSESSNEPLSVNSKGNSVDLSVDLFGVRRRTHSNDPDQRSASPAFEPSSDSDHSKSIIPPALRHLSSSLPREKSLSVSSTHSVTHSANAVKKKDSDRVRSNSEMSVDGHVPEVKHKLSIFEGIMEASHKGLAGITQHMQIRRGNSINDNMSDTSKSDIDVQSFMNWRLKRHTHKSTAKSEADEELNRKAEYWERYGISHRLSELSFDPTNDLLQLLSNNLNISSNPNLVIDYHPFV